MKNIAHQFSMHFAPDTDVDFKNQQFESGLKNFIEGFIQYYPHLITKTVRDGVDVWVFKFEIDNK